MYAVPATITQMVGAAGLRDLFGMLIVGSMLGVSSQDL